MTMTPVWKTLRKLLASEVFGGYNDRLRDGRRSIKITKIRHDQHAVTAIADLLRYNGYDAVVHESIDVVFKAPPVYRIHTPPHPTLNVEQSDRDPSDQPCIDVNPELWRDFTTAYNAVWASEVPDPVSWSEAEVTQWLDTEFSDCLSAAESAAFDDRPDLKIICTGNTTLH